MAQSLAQDVFQSLSPTPLSNATPQPNGAASPGTSPQASRADHVHAAGVLGAITFDTAPPIPPYAEGQVYWNQLDKTLNVETGIDNTTVQVGQENHVIIYNNTGATITNGKVVYINGASAGRPTVALANANSPVTADTVLGVATHDIENITEGLITTFGLVNGVNTALWASGTQLYLDTANGALTSSQPSSPNYVVRIGVVVTQNAVTGSIYVDPQVVTQTANSIHIDSGAGVTVINNVQDFFRLSWAAGVATGAALTDNLDGTVDIAAGEVAIRTSDADDATLIPLVITAQAGITITADDVSYLYVDYNAGTPIWVVTTDFTQCNGHDKIIGYAVGRIGTKLNIVDLRGINVNADCKGKKQKVESDGFIFDGWYRSRFGNSALGSSGLNLTTAAGRYYFVDNVFTHAAFDTSVAGTANQNVFKYFYNRTGAWTVIDDQKTINNTQYDSGGALTTMSNNKWRTDWVYMVMGATPYLAVILGNAEYDNITAAELAPLPILPPQIDGIAVLAGRVVLQKAAGSLSVSVAGSTTFTGSSAASIHNNLASIQGGQTSEYYHLTSAEYTGTGSGTFIRQVDPAIRFNTSTKVANYTIGLTDYTIRGDASGGAIVITLPDATTCEGQLFVVKKVDSSSNAVTVNTTAAQTIDGGLTAPIYVQFASITLQSNGTNFDIL